MTNSNNNNNTLKINSKPANNNLVVPLQKKLLQLKHVDGYGQEEVHCFCHNRDNLCRFLVARDNDLNKSYVMAAAAGDLRLSHQPSRSLISLLPMPRALGALPGMPRMVGPSFLCVQVSGTLMPTQQKNMSSMLHTSWRTMQSAWIHPIQMAKDTSSFLT